MSRHFPKGRALDYVQTERNWALLISAWGVASTTAGLIGMLYRSLPLVAGMGWPFLLAGLSLLAIGVRHLAWALRHGVIVEAHPAHLPKHFLQEEWERLEVLIPLLQRGRELCLLFFILGLSLALMARILDWGPFSLGIGTGLVIQAVFTLIYLLFRLWRNELYGHELKTAGH